MPKLMLEYLVLTLLLCSSTRAYPSFRDLIPNGNRVPDPCVPGATWYGVGHLNAQGGGPRNEFGKDFAAANNQWTEELCKMDSDGDGLTNGQELGDPDCTWEPTKQPNSTTGLSHPGINNDTGCECD